MLEKGFNAIGKDIEQECIYCGRGKYQLMVDGNPTEGYGELRSFGLDAIGAPIWKVFVCDYCGNIQLFRPDNSRNPNIWE